MTKKVAKSAKDVIGKKIVSIYSCWNHNTAVDVQCVHIETEDTILEIGTTWELYPFPTEGGCCVKNSQEKKKYYY